VPAGLGRVLLDRGYAAAGAELLSDAADLPPSFSHATNFREALSDLYRRRGELFRDAGDAHLRLDDPQRALELYDRGAALPLLDPDAMLNRRVAALMRLGRPAAAAAAVLTSIDERGGQIRTQHVDLLQTIAGAGGAGPAIIEALQARAETASPDVARATSHTRIRAIAALLPPDDARAFLREQIVAEGGDADLIADLYRRIDAADTGALVREAVLLTDADPIHVDRYVDAMLVSRPSIGTLLAHTEPPPDAPSSTAAAALVRARLLTLEGRFADALSTLRAPTLSGDASCAAALARVRALRSLAEHDAARAELDAIDHAACPEAAVGAAELLDQIDRAADALALLEEAERDPTLPAWHRARIALTAARILVSERRYPEAERRYTQVLALDPTNEHAHAGLIALFSQGGPLANEARLMAVVRALRDTAPDSRTFRLLRARDAVARGRADLAERELLDLVERHPEDPAIVALLVRVWVDQDRPADAEAWLRERLTRMPGARTDRIELARLLVEGDRAREAATLLEEWLTLSPADEAASQTLEAIYRGPLDDPEYATQLARQRLQRAPVTVDTLGETALVQVQELQQGSAVATVGRMLDLSIATGRPIGQWGNRIAAEIAGQLNAEAINPDQARAILGDLALRTTDFSEAAHIARVQLVGQSDVPVTEMIAAAELVASRFPPARDRAYDALLAAIRTGRVLEPPRSTPAVVDAPGAIRRPLNAPTGNEREERALLAQRLALGLAVVDHLRTDREAPLRASTSALALDIARRVVQLSDDPAASEFLGGAIDDLLTRPDRDDVLSNWVRMNPEAVEDAVQGPITANQKADALDTLSSMLHNAGDDARADRLGRLALELNPDHPTANNNLGYRFLERDEHIAEATAMIERAYRLTPDAPNVIDSMAWAMYKNGIIHDEFDAAGTFIRPGAITLLTRALKIIEAQNRTADVLIMRPVLLDHLGDAQWAGGDRAAAEKTWYESIRFVDSALTPEFRERMGMMITDIAFVELEKTRAGLRAKIAAIDAGTDPPIARIHGPVNSPAPPGTPEDLDRIPDDRPLGDPPPVEADDEELPGQP
jgi:tetratricopeptide (TPR) repeat protein